MQRLRDIIQHLLLLSRAVRFLCRRGRRSSRAAVRDDLGHILEVHVLDRVHARLREDRNDVVNDDERVEHDHERADRRGGQRRERVDRDGEHEDARGGERVRLEPLLFAELVVGLGRRLGLGLVDDGGRDVDVVERRLHGAEALCELPAWRRRRRAYAARRKTHLRWDSNPWPPD